MKPSRTSRVVPGFDRHDARPWSVAVFRQVRRADLRTGYAGPKASPIARLRAAARAAIDRYWRGRAAPHTND